MRVEHEHALILLVQKDLRRVERGSFLRFESQQRLVIKSFLLTLENTHSTPSHNKRTPVIVANSKLAILSVIFLRFLVLATNAHAASLVAEL
eukprot:CAMPEP_0185852358 /NCGR_PEP_ID=MMETSP1354-20130828/14412_1 /TAXON_ID=708628 /ORGANISM="Erythrolobus madagascarensis, Strain CCMP3276" /LENGTH=91 /DNA_ID=CAMNT_0028553579 /DNA_START=238 /DNA_END=513 /DNA_ORIENTATION=+